jgi:hypothetical protein
MVVSNGPLIAMIHTGRLEKLMIDGPVSFVDVLSKYLK